MDAGRLRVLIIGGYGTFGGRLAKLLASDARFTLLIGGRSPARARDFCRAIAASAELAPVMFDRDGDVQAQIAALGPNVVVDASGPFQAYGEDCYRVVKACIALGTNYIDLADARSFVGGIVRFDADAIAHNVAVLSGASTLPALSAAVLR